jgi:ATP-dependent DNA helicase RecG
MVKSTDGFEISDVDLRLRGPGDLEGTQQSGVLDMKIANLIKDEAVLRITRTNAQRILDEDPGLQLEKNQRIARQFYFLNKKKADWAMIS